MTKLSTLNAPALTFQSVEITPIIKDGKTWFTSADLSRALGYSDVRQVSRTYARNEDEFTPSMSLVVKLNTKGFGSGESPKPTRIFSLRGCHLIAMLARSHVAKDFRRWVLDLLDKEAEKASAGSIQTISPAQQRAIQKLVADRVYASNLANTSMGFSAMYRALKDRFCIASYNQLPAIQFDEAVQFIAECPIETPKLTSEKLTPNDMTNVRRLMWAVSAPFHDGQGFINMLWKCLREVTGRKSPSPFYVEDIPAIAKELKRIGTVLRPFAKAIVNAKRTALKRLVKNREDLEVIMKDVEEQMKIDIELSWIPNKVDTELFNLLVLREKNEFATEGYQEKLD